jgi:hypothetical protein
MENGMKTSQKTFEKIVATYLEELIDSMFEL